MSSEQQRKAFPFSEFEPKWQDVWEAQKAFRTPNPGDADFDASKPKYFVLDKVLFAPIAAAVESD